MTGKQIDKLIAVLERFASVAERWADREYPVHDETPVEIYRAGATEEPQSREEYQALEGPGRFEKNFSSSLRDS